MSWKKVSPADKGGKRNKRQESPRSVRGREWPVVPKSTRDNVKKKEKVSPVRRNKCGCGRSKRGYL
ncbi:hypothetical protein J2Z83_002111 [Virgibacillus natechei]|uniref:Uncharacterized protein n=1 Tax=Virgibacillus natechei TaxID=1216297 RepID=A0ABS4IGC8_9BACI|nr:hypothetical protein [Virgibacillus natechei]MBP1970003.1 hypothetical protein [Virgibacillus natechei]UZD13339.1 hypothetical protein OLD84_01890 [Virgibacillus natechei]